MKHHKPLYFTIFLFFLFTCSTTGYCGDFTYTNASGLESAGKNFEILEDNSNAYNEQTILSANKFTQSQKDIPVFPTAPVNEWIRFSLLNSSSIKDIYLFLEYFDISKITIYKQTGNSLSSIYVDGNELIHKRSNSLPSYIANLSLGSGERATYYMHIQSAHPVVLVAYFATNEKVQAQTQKLVFTVSAYFGIIIAVFFYNLFIYFSTKDKDYLRYIIYIFFLAFAQLTLAGYSAKFLWLGQPHLNYYGVPVTTCLAEISGIIFTFHFLRTRVYTKLIHRLLLAAIGLMSLAIALSFFHNNNFSYNIITSVNLAIGVLVLTAAFNISRKGYRPALYYAISFASFLAGLIIFSLRNFNVLPANSFTNYILYLGSAVEAVLLSIALADKINVLKKEKEQSQAEALERARENEKLVSEQNIVLEKQVAKRTAELQTANTNLNDALINLKDAQAQLVDAEKMASLGQLTAGIAHEINNPINFVKSNINPLRLDVNDLLNVLNAYDELHSLSDHHSYKEKLGAIQDMKEDLDLQFLQTEIDSLILGIEDGAERTAEIVRGLRTFSRIDESALKTVDIHDGILSTIVLLKNNIPYYIKLVKEFNGTGEIECFPGKINQVFMNILTNAVQAIKSKPVKQEEEMITIETKDVEDDMLEISIKDSGPGMSDEVKHRIFEPFFTTKDVGEGTGLGMAIVFKIIQKHAGKINIISAPNEGAEFVITLPHRYRGTD